MLDKNKLALEYERILPRYILEERHDQKKLSDGQSLTGVVGQDDSYTPIMWVLMGSPFFSGLITGAIILLNEFVSLVDMSYTFFGPITIGWALFITIYSVLTHHLLKGCLISVAEQNALVYFEEGVHSAFRQLYLAKTELQDEEYQRLLNNRLEHERRMNLLINILEDERSSG